MNNTRGGIDQSSRACFAKDHWEEQLDDEGPHRVLSPPALCSPLRLLRQALRVAQQKLVLKASDVHPAGYPTVDAVEHIGKKLERPPTAA